MKRLVLPLALALSSCSAQAVQAPSPQPRGFADRLTDLVFGTKSSVVLKTGYPVLQMQIIDQVDRPHPEGEGVNPAPLTGMYRGLDLAYADPPTSGSFGGLPISGTSNAPTARRVALAATVYGLGIGPFNARSPLEKRVSMLTVLTYSAAGEPQLATEVDQLLAHRSWTRARIGPSCTLYQATDRAGYIDAAVMTIRSGAGGEIDLRERANDRCFLAAQIFNLGFSDAVQSRRLDAFPRVAAQTEGCVLRLARPGVQEGLRCYSPYTGRALYHLGATMIRLGLLPPGRIARADFRQRALQAVGLLGTRLLDAEEAEDRRRWRSDKDIGPPPVVPR